MIKPNSIYKRHLGAKDGRYYFLYDLIDDELGEFRAITCATECSSETFYLERSHTDVVSVIHFYSSQNLDVIDNLCVLFITSELKQVGFEPVAWLNWCKSHVAEIKPYQEEVEKRLNTLLLLQ